MLASIHPLGERARNTSWGLTATAYAIGSAAGGSLLGALLGLAGRAVHAVVGTNRVLIASVVAAVCGLGALADLQVTRLRTPTIRRQVNEDWLHRYRGWVYGVGFGFQLGLGVVTIVTSASVYVTFALAFAAGLSGSLAGAVGIGLVFGLVRAAPMLSMARVWTPEQLRSNHRRMQALAPICHRLAIGLQVLVAVVVGPAIVL